jgi:parvulin-like peptidyl-prolyl isomerase
MKTLTRFLPLICVAAAACASPTYLARVNDQPVTGQDLKDEFSRRHAGHSSFLAGEIETRKFLDLVIDQKLLVQEAYRLDLASQPDIQKAVADQTEKKGAEYLVKVEIEQKGKPTQEEIRAAWEKNTMVVYRARQIVLDTRAEAEAVYQQIVGGADFENAARACSIAGSRIYGGNLPYVGWGALDPRWEDVVFSMTPGELSAPFETQDGWEIVQLQEILVGERPALEKVDRRIDGILKKRKLAARKREMTEYLWTKYHARRTDVDLSPESLHDALAKTPDAKLVTWDGGSLSFKEFAGQIEWNEFAGLLPGRFRAEMEEQLRRVVNEPLARLEAKDRHYEKVPEIAEALRHYQEGLMEGALYADFVLKKVAVGDEELKSWYEAHKGDFVEPEKRRVAHIVLPTKEEAVAIRKAIDDGQPFEMLVKTKSTDTASQKQVGDLGWITRAQATGEFEKVFGLAEGEISEPLQSKFGYHVMRVTKITPARPLDFDDAKEAIRKTVLEKKQREARLVWVRKLREAATVKISDAGVRAFVKSNSAEALSAAPPSHEVPPSHESARKEKS